jgi:hypothetical protein
MMESLACIPRYGPCHPGAADLMTMASCSKALDHDPYCVKALYRRARGQYMRCTSTGLEAAVSDLQAALKLEPGNAQVGVADQWQQHMQRQKIGCRV